MTNPNLAPGGLLKKWAFATPSSAAQAREIQNELRHRVIIRDDFKVPQTIAGIDVGYDFRENVSRGALVLMDFETLETRTVIVETEPTPFPYIPGLLSFREAPVIFKLLARLPDLPDMLMIDGQGIAHPRRLGIASHIGAITDIPALGVAKSVLCGHYAEPALTRGSQQPLIHQDEKIATAYRSRDNVKPIFISPGHRMGHDSAVSITARCLTRYRLPEPTRQADKYSKIGVPLPSHPLL